MNKLKHFVQSVVTAALIFTTSVTALAMEVPNSETCQEVNGRQILTRVFSVDPDTDPAVLISADFEKDGFIYTFDSIIKTEKEFSDVKRVTKEYTFTSDTEDLGENIMKLPAALDYEDEDGYLGNLYLEPRSVATEATGYHTESRVSKATISYPNLAYNDPTLLPATTKKNGVTLPLYDVSWSEGDYLTDSSVPSTYTATATYRKTLYSKVADGYQVSAEYYGTVQQDGIEVIEYTVTYLGSVPERGFFDFLGTSTGPQTNGVSAGSHALPMIVLILAGLLALALLVWLILNIIKLFRNLFVTVQAQDDITGEYKMTQRVRLSKKNLVIELNTMKSPGALHYRFTIPKQKAKDLIGKVITIHSAQETFSHQIGDAHGQEYSFSIDFSPEAVPRSGPSVSPGRHRKGKEEN